LTPLSYDFQNALERYGHFDLGDAQEEDMTIRNDQLLCVEDEIAINNTWAANYKIYTYDGDGDGIFGDNWKNRAGARESE
jgi:hypothetical protein